MCIVDILFSVLLTIVYSIGSIGWWILNDIEIAFGNVHFRYRGSIEYRDTRDGIVIVAPISGIAQH